LTGCRVGEPTPSRYLGPSRHWGRDPALPALTPTATLSHRTSESGGRLRPAYRAFPVPGDTPHSARIYVGTARAFTAGARTRRIVSLPAPDAPTTPRTELVESPELPWLGPYPDHLLEPTAPADAEPDALVIGRETIELTYLAAIQHLPPRQRAIFVLRDSLDWSVQEIAALLETTVFSVKSDLQLSMRARQESGPEKRRPVLRPFSAPQGRANPRVSGLNESSRVVVVSPASRFRGRTRAGRRRQPRLHVLPAVSEMGANAMRPRPLPLVAPRVQRLHRNPKVASDLGWRGQPSGAGRRRSRFVSRTTQHRSDERRPLQ
jgi:Sigma-70, region 4